jgi:formate--tetrahydrofolate ligase
LGAEKFLDIKCRAAGLDPDAVVIVATVKALKYNGGVPKTELAQENLEALERGLPNLLKHIENITKVFGLPCVVAINRFVQDTDAELELIRQKCRSAGANVALTEVWAKGGAGGETLAEEVLRLCDYPHEFRHAYELNTGIKEKIETIVRRIYGGSGVSYSKAAEQAIANLERLGYGDLAVCMAKTQYSLSDDPAKLGRPTDFTVTVSKVKVSAGAGFIVAQTGDIMTMPGLPKVPAAERIDIDENGTIVGLF